MDLEALLQQRFGHSGFRPGQRDIIDHVVDGHDALVVMPTGAGKSLCYQLPALARGGTPARGGAGLMREIAVAGDPRPRAGRRSSTP